MSRQLTPLGDKERARIYKDQALWPKCGNPKCKLPIPPPIKTLSNGSKVVRWQVWFDRKYCCRPCQNAIVRKPYKERKNKVHKSVAVNSDKPVGLATAFGKPIKPGFYCFTMESPKFHERRNPHSSGFPKELVEYREKRLKLILDEI